ncbi:Regucalcin [Termitomyces sp. J132]|nr:Regucalcin [Termitomyces sp. J132]
MAPTQIVAGGPWFRSGCTLGEGPLYDPETSTLHFVDISEKKIHHLNTQTLEIQVEQFDAPVTCLALRRDKPGLACAAAEGFALIESNLLLRYLSQPLSLDVIPHTRFNDGGCDSKGRFFAGTICSKEHGIPGKLYRYDPHDNTCVVVDDGPFTDSNGLGWSPDEKIFYFTDSLNNKIYAYDYDDGNLSNRRLFVDAIALGMPKNTFCDGLCTDSEGGVWSARWGGSRILRFTKDGVLDVEIIIPTALNITACCFGGDKNDQLFVTTAHCGANGGDPSRQTKFPDSGHVFKIDLSGRYMGNERHEFSG